MSKTELELLRVRVAELEAALAERRPGAAWPLCAENPFRNLANALPSMVWTCRADGYADWLNDKWYELTGQANPEAIGWGWADIIHPDDRDRVVAAWQAAVKTDEPFETEVRYRMADGEYRSHLVRALPVLDDEGKVDHWFGTSTDIDDKNQAQADLEARTQAILETAVDGIITIDQYGIVRSFNRAAERIFGYMSDAIMGKNINVLMPSPYHEEHDRYLKTYLETGVKKIIGIGREVEGRRKDGTTFPCEVAVSEVPSANERLFTGIVRDITEKKLVEERARQSERLAAIGQTVTGLAHESRNAFQRSQACLEMLALELEDRPEELELVDRIQRALDHLHHLYEEVRDYAAPIKLDRQLCDLAHVWRDSWSHLELARKQKNVELLEEIEGIDLSCDVDWFQLGQVFRNILENAIAACPDPGKIVIRARPATIDGQPAITVAVIDDGPGFEPQSKSKVFDAFFTTKTKGTGLGMAIARRIVEAHGGEIVIGDSTAGAEIVVTLPRRNI